MFRIILSVLLATQLFNTASLHAGTPLEFMPGVITSHLMDRECSDWDARVEGQSTPEISISKAICKRIGERTYQWLIDLSLTDEALSKLQSSAPHVRMSLKPYIVHATSCMWARSSIQDLDPVLLRTTRLGDYEVSVSFQCKKLSNGLGHRPFEVYSSLDFIRVSTLDESRYVQIPMEDRKIFGDDNNRFWCERMRQEGISEARLSQNSGYSFIKNSDCFADDRGFFRTLMVARSEIVEGKFKFGTARSFFRGHTEDKAKRRCADLIADPYGFLEDDFQGLRLSDRPDAQEVTTVTLKHPGMAKWGAECKTVDRGDGWGIEYVPFLTIP